MQFDQPLARDVDRAAFQNMSRSLKYWQLTGCGQAFRAHVIAYADDFVILSRGYAAEALAWTRRAMTRLGLTLNEVKPRLR